MTAMDIIKKPIVTEKSTELLSEGKYTFEVHRRATKIEIAKAVEELFEVKVLRVSTMNMLGKYRNTNGRKGKKSDWKKAIVQIDLAPDTTIYLEKDGKEKKINKKYKTEIEGFMGV